MSFQEVAIDPLGGLCWPGGEELLRQRFRSMRCSGWEGKLDGPVKMLKKRATSPV